MQPLRLALSRELNLRWPELLDAEGLRVEGAAGSGTLSLFCAGAEYRVTGVLLDGGELILDTTQITEGGLRRHLEAALRASGASFTITPHNETDVDALYRCQARTLSAAADELRASGARTELAPRPPLCGSAHGSPGPFWSGSVASGTSLVHIETGPCLDPQGYDRMMFVSARPAFRFWPRQALRRLVTTMDGVLRRHGAVPVTASVLLG